MKYEKLKENEKKLIDWCWEYLEFNNNPETWEDTYIIDILKGYSGTCHLKTGESTTYTKIRIKFGL